MFVHTQPNVVKVLSTSDEQQGKKKCGHPPTYCYLLNRLVAEWSVDSLSHKTLLKYWVDQKVPAVSRIFQKEISNLPQQQNIKGMWA